MSDLNRRTALGLAAGALASPALARTVISEVDKNLLHETPHDLPHVLVQTVFPLTAD